MNPPKLATFLNWFYSRTYISYQPTGWGLSSERPEGTTRTQRLPGFDLVGDWLALAAVERDRGGLGGKE